jgi:hypothetical protein
MTLRTFPRATAAGLVAAALGSTTPALAQTPAATLPTAPAPRAKPAANRLTVVLGYNSAAGLTGSIVLETLEEAPLPVAPPPREVTAPRPTVVDLNLTTGACPLPGQFAVQARPVVEIVRCETVEAVAVNGLKPLVVGPARVVSVTPLPTPRYLTRYPQYFPADLTFPLPRELAGMTDLDYPQYAPAAPLPRKPTLTAPAAQAARPVTVTTTVRAVPALHFADPAAQQAPTYATPAQPAVVVQPVPFGVPAPQSLPHAVPVVESVPFTTTVALPVTYTAPVRPAPVAPLVTYTTPVLPAPVRYMPPPPPLPVPLPRAVTPTLAKDVLLPVQFTLPAKTVRPVGTADAVAVPYGQLRVGPALPADPAAAQARE